MTPTTTKKNRIEIPNFGAVEVREQNNIKMLFYKKNVPRHLTVSWRNYTNEVDIHLTERTNGGREDHQSIAKIPEANLIEVLKSFESELQRSIAEAFQKRLIYRVQPEWLERNRFVLFAPSDEAQKEITSKLIQNKNKWTHILNPEALSDKKWSKSLSGDIHPPSILHALAAQRYANPIFARCRGRKSQLIVLHLVANLNEQPYWVAMKTKFFKQLKSLLRSFVLGQLPEDDWAKISNELQLDSVASL